MSVYSQYDYLVRLIAHIKNVVLSTYIEMVWKEHCHREGVGAIHSVKNGISLILFYQFIQNEYIIMALERKPIDGMAN